MTRPHQCRTIFNLSDMEEDLLVSSTICISYSTALRFRRRHLRNGHHHIGHARAASPTSGQPTPDANHPISFGHLDSCRWSVEHTLRLSSMRTKRRCGVNPPSPTLLLSFAALPSPCSFTRACSTARPWTPFHRCTCPPWPPAVRKILVLPQPAPFPASSPMHMAPCSCSHACSTAHPWPLILARGFGGEGDWGMREREGLETKRENPGGREGTPLRQHT